MQDRGLEIVDADRQIADVGGQRVAGPVDPATLDAADGGRLHAVLTPRLSFSPALHANDIGALNLQLGEPYMARSPEDLAASLRLAFDQASPDAPSGGS